MGILKRIPLDHTDPLTQTIFQIVNSFMPISLLLRTERTIYNIIKVNLSRTFQVLVLGSVEAIRGFTAIGYPCILKTVLTNILWTTLPDFIFPPLTRTYKYIMPDQVRAEFGPCRIKSGKVWT